MSAANENQHYWDRVLSVYREASEGHRQEHRNMWHTLYVFLAVNGLLLGSLIKVTEAKLGRPLILVIAITGGVATLAGLAIIGRMFQYSKRDVQICKKIEIDVPFEFRRCAEIPLGSALTKRWQSSHTDLPSKLPEQPAVDWNLMAGPGLHLAALCPKSNCVIRCHQSLHRLYEQQSHWSHFAFLSPHIL